MVGRVAGARRQGRREAQQGSALVVVVLVSTTLGLLGLAYLTFAEMEQARAREGVERARSREAARDVLRIASSWLDPAGAPTAPAPDAWVRNERRGDWDGDGSRDAACDGRTEAGRLVISPSELATARERGPQFRPCGTTDTPDLVLRDPSYLGRLSGLLGRDVVVEEVSVSAPPRHDGRDLALATVACRVAVRRGHLLVARRTALARVVRLPSLRGGEVVAAGADVELEPGARVRWGIVEAAGDAYLPSVAHADFPRSGLPRTTGGRIPVDWAPGGVLDWDLRSRRRDYVLTELLGATRSGRRVHAQWPTPPVLPDPWLSVRAAGDLFLDGEGWCEPPSHQPWPYDPRRGGVEADLSHLSCHWSGSDALREGDAEALVRAQASAADGARIRRFLLARAAGEPTWREAGVGPARTAAEWLDELGDAPRLVAFVTAAAPPPARVTIPRGSGVLLVQAEELVLEARGNPSQVPVAMPGEPFLDVGLDLDADGEPDGDTAGNGRWDADSDGDAVSDEGRAWPWALESVHDGAVMGAVPDGDEDPTRLSDLPHEPWLNLLYPAEDATDLGVRVDFQAGGDEGRRVVGAVDGPDGPRFTTRSREEIGARIRLPVHASALVVNLTGDVVVAEGFLLHGAIRAAGSVRLRAGSQVTFDAALARGGWSRAYGLPGVGLTAVRLEDARRHARGRRAPAGDAPDASGGSEAPPGPGASDAGGGADDGGGRRPRGEPRQPLGTARSDG